MKTQFKPLALSLALKPIMSKRSLLGSALLISSVALTGCQSVGTNPQGEISLAASQDAAKSTLETALKKQRRSSFSYHSNIEISNEQQFLNINKTQLVASETAARYCEETHDQAYADLVAQAQAQNLELSALQYNPQRTALKNEYLACAQAYRAWDANKADDYDSYDGSYEDNYDSYNNYGDEAIAEASDELYASELTVEGRGNEGATIIETSTIKGNRLNETKYNGTSQNISPYYQQLFDNYDNKSTPLDIKKAQLLDAYLLKPLSINAQGVYQPLAGRFTMLMSAQYQGRNNHTTINQPIYVDFKTGNIYLWVDNFALLTSEFADDKLGTQWHNKWLRLAIDDGSLPKGFGKSVIKAHFEALDRTYEAAPVSQFDYVAPTTLATLSPKLPKPQLNTMQQTPQIIRRVQSAESYEQFYKDYVSIFYELITNQYPELVQEDKAYELGDPRPDATKLTSKVLVQQALSLMKNVTDQQADSIVSEVFEGSARSENESMDSNDANQQPTIQLLYGLNGRGQIQWQHQRNQYADPEKASEGLTVDVLQQYMPVSSVSAFPNLPADRQIPNASNSVDIRKYGRELMEYYRAGNGTAVGKMVYNTLPINKALYFSMIEQAQYQQANLEAAEEDSVE
ncbi:hypothetical protein ACS8E3_08450 [Psychrobacter sp. 2Y5]|uniref:hypothetical protein n=1 Tax=unclassified Psychrobacter TaxID=196806 RepID=UPI003F465E25